MIKFRGKRLSDGQTIYGCYHERGYDRNGDEVYEGDDVVVDGKWDDYAELVPRTSHYDASFGSVTLKNRSSYEED